MKIIYFIALLTLFSFPLFAAEVSCVEGGTVSETQEKMNNLITTVPAWREISAPSLLLKHSGLENPYVMCVTTRSRAY